MFVVYHTQVSKIVPSLARIKDHRSKKVLEELVVTLSSLDEVFMSKQKKKESTNDK